MASPKKKIVPEKKILIRKLKEIIPNEILDLEKKIGFWSQDWSITGKDKRKLIFIRQISGVYTRVGSRKISSHITSVTFGKKVRRTFPLNMSLPGYRSKNTFFYYLNLDDGKQLTFSGAENPISTQLMDVTFNRHIVSEMVAGLKKKSFNEYIFYIIVGVICALPTGFIIGQLVK